MKLRPRLLRSLAREALLVARVSQAEGADSAAAMAFALECDPTVRGTALWRRCERGVDGLGRTTRWSVTTTSDWRWRLRSQRWQRWGT